MNFDYHAVAALLHTAIPLAAGAAGVGYYILRSKGQGFASAHLLVGVPMFAIGAAAELPVPPCSITTEIAYLGFL